MLTEIRLDNFKCFRELKLPLRQFNIWVGKNGTGKSTPAQALALLKQSLNHGSFQFGGPLVKFDGFDEVLFHGARERKTGVGFSATVAEAIAPLFGFNPPQQLEYNYSWQIVDPGRDINTISGSLSCATANLKVEGGRLVQGSLRAERGYSPSFGSWDGTIGRLFRVASWHAEGRAPDDSWHEEAEAESICISPQKALQRFYLVPAVRGFREPKYRLHDQPSDSVDDEGGVASTLEYNREQIEEISNLLSTITGCPVDVLAEPQQQIKVARRGTTPRRSIVTEGFGSNQLVPLLRVVVAAPKGATIAIEEPEIHLHPAAQVTLFEALLEEARKRELQFIFVTHSFHWLMAALRSVKTGRMKQEELTIREFVLEQADQGAKSDDVQFNKQGLLQRNLTGFLEPYLEEYQDLLNALASGKAG